MSTNQNSIQFIPMTCPNCGGELMISSKLSQAICNYCGKSFLVVENKSKYEANAANFIQLAKIAYDSGNYEEAYGYYNKALELDPENYSAWFGKACTSFWNSEPFVPLNKEFTYFAEEAWRKMDQVKFYFEKAFSCAPEIKRESLQKNSQSWLFYLWAECAQTIEQKFNDAFEHYGGDDFEKENILLDYIASVSYVLPEIDLIMKQIDINENKDLFPALSHIESMSTKALWADKELYRHQIPFSSEGFRKTREASIEKSQKYSEKYSSLKENLFNKILSKD
jgi:tetratricopeptide (TPR) repeat protein